MSKEEQKTFLPHASGSIYFNFYMAALCTGMCIGEVLGLQWDDMDFENKILRVTGTLVYIRGEGRFKDTPKTQTGYRTIPMVSQMEVMLKQRQVQQTMMKFSLKSLYKDEGFVFTSKSGGPFWDTAIRVDGTFTIFHNNSGIGKRAGNDENEEADVKQEKLKVVYKPKS